MNRIGFVQRALLELNLPISTFSEADIREILCPRIVEMENALLEDTRAAQAEMKVILEAGQQRVRLPRDVATIDHLEVNGTDYSNSRVPVQEINLL